MQSRRATDEANAGRSMQAQAANQNAALRAAMSDQGMDWNVANRNAGIDQANAERALRAGIFSSDAFNQASRFGATAANQAGQFNASAANQASRDNQSAGLQAQGLRMDAARGGMNGVFDANRIQSALNQQLAQQGAQQRQIRQQMQDQDYQDWQSIYNAPFDRIDRLVSTLNTTPYEQSQTTSQESDPFASVMGMAMMAAPFVLSDRRAKRSVVKLGTAPSGLGVYAYRYKGDHTPKIGHMADEVRAVRPDAVAKTPWGYDAVAYDRLAA
jgi:hypothetical protein